MKDCPYHPQRAKRGCDICDAVKRIAQLQARLDEEMRFEQAIKHQSSAHIIRCTDGGRPMVFRMPPPKRGGTRMKGRRGVYRRA